MNVRRFIISSLLVIISASFGVAGGYYLGKRKYLSMADKEIESVKKMYEKHYSNEKPVVQALKEEPKEVAKNDNANEDETLVKYKNYAGLYGDNKEIASPIRSIKTPEQKNNKKVKKNNFHVISPEEYRDFEGEIITLIYYSDKVLADNDGNVIHNINEVIGPEALSTFGRYEDDCVYVKDDEQNVVYEIIWENKSYVAAHAND